MESLLKCLDIKKSLRYRSTGEPFSGPNDFCQNEYILNYECDLTLDDPWRKDCWSNYCSYIWVSVERRLRLCFWNLYTVQNTLTRETILLIVINPHRVLRHSPIYLAAIPRKVCFILETRSGLILVWMPFKFFRRQIPPKSILNSIVMMMRIGRNDGSYSSVNFFTKLIQDRTRASQVGWKCRTGW